MSARAKNVDWPAIERDFRAGLLSLRELGKVHGLGHVTIKKRADREGWTRDLAAKIQAKAESIVNASMVNSKENSGDRVSERQTVEVNGNLVADVRLRHRSDISRLRALSMSLLAELEQQTTDPALLKQFTEMMRAPNEFGADRLNDMMQKIVSLPNRADTVKKLAETLRIALGLEREAWGMDLKGAEDDKPVNALASLLMSMRVSALPVVYEVERDDNL